MRARWLLGFRAFQHVTFICSALSTLPCAIRALGEVVAVQIGAPFSGVETSHAVLAGTHRLGKKAGGQGDMSLKRFVQQQ